MKLPRRIYFASALLLSFWLEVLPCRSESLAARPALVVLGDSIAHRWPAQLLSAVFQADVVNLARNGDRIEDTFDLIRSGRAAALGAASYVLLMVGTNDVRLENIDQIARELGNLVAAIKAKNSRAKLYVMSLLPRTGVLYQKGVDIRAINDKIEAMARKDKFAVIGVPPMVLSQCSRFSHCALFSDNVHPNAQGYIEMTRMLQSVAAKSAQ